MGVKLLVLLLLFCRHLEGERRLPSVSFRRMSLTRAREAAFAVVQSVRFDLDELSDVTREPMDDGIEGRDGVMILIIAHINSSNSSRSRK